MLLFASGLLSLVFILHCDHYKTLFYSVFCYHFVLLYWIKSVTQVVSTKKDKKEEIDVRLDNVTTIQFNYNGSIEYKTYYQI